MTSPSRVTARQILRQREGSSAPKSETKTLRLSKARTLAELMRNPELLEPPQAVVPKIAWRGRTTLLAAREKAGKSTLVTEAAAAVTTGGTFLGEPCLAGPVLWVLVEEAEADLVQRASKVCDPERFHVLIRPADPMADLAHEIAVIVPLLVVIDTLPTFARAMVREPSSSAEWIKVLAPINDLARDYHVAIILNHHASRATGEYRDSTAIGASVDVILEMDSGTVDDPTLRRIAAKGRFPVDSFAVRLAEDGYMLADTSALSLDTRVLTYVERSPGCPKRAIREYVGGRASEADAAIDRLVNAGEIVNDGGESRHAYRCPRTHPEPVGTRGSSEVKSLRDKDQTRSGHGGVS